MLLSDYFNIEKWQLLTFISIMMIIVVCTPDITQNDKNTELILTKNPIQYTIGQKWLYKRLFVIPGLDTLIPGHPDTLLGYAYYEVKKDTVIDSITFFIIVGKDYEVDSADINFWIQRFAVYSNDSGVFVYKLDSNTSFSNGPFKLLNRYENNNIKISDLSSINKVASIFYNIISLSNVSNYLSFYDFFCPILFPLIKDSSWYYRTPENPYGHGEVKKTFIGLDNIIINGEIYNAYKIEWEYIKNNQLFNDTIIGFDWFNDIGLLKRFSYVSKSTLVNEIGIVIGEVEIYDILLYLYAGDFNPDTLIPWGL